MIYHYISNRFSPYPYNFTLSFPQNFGSRQRREPWLRTLIISLAPKCVNQAFTSLAPAPVLCMSPTPTCFAQKRCLCTNYSFAGTARGLFASAARMPASTRTSAHSACAASSQVKPTTTRIGESNLQVRFSAVCRSVVNPVSSARAAPTG